VSKWCNSWGKVTGFEIRVLADVAQAKYDYEAMRTFCVILIIVAIGAGAAMWFSRSIEIPAPQPVTVLFDMPIDDAFRLKIEGSVVVVGVIAKGEISPGMNLEIRGSTTAIPVTVTALEGGPGNPISHARAGDRVSVMLQGASKDQIPTGSRLVGRPNGEREPVNSRP
jgi:hypothetical protein